MLMKIMKTCIAAAVALGFSLAVPAASYAQGDKDKSATASTDKPKAPAKHKKHKKHKKGFAGKENQSEGGK
jgi:hypothetical protein